MKLGNFELSPSARGSYTGGPGGSVGPAVVDGDVVVGGCVVVVGCVVVAGCVVVVDGGGAAVGWAVVGGTAVGPGRDVADAPVEPTPRVWSDEESSASQPARSNPTRPTPT